MRGLVADTHTILWYLLASDKISSPAMAALDETVAAGDAIYVPAISVIEIAYLVEKGKLPDAALDRLIDYLASSGSSFLVVPLDLAIALTAQRIPRETLSDMPDRIIAATALHLNLPLVTRDRKIQAAGIKTVW